MNDAHITNKTTSVNKIVTILLTMKTRIVFSFRHLVISGLGNNALISSQLIFSFRYLETNCLYFTLRLFYEYYT